MGDSSWQSSGYQIFGCCAAGAYLFCHHFFSEFYTISMIVEAHISLVMHNLFGHCSVQDSLDF